MQPSNSRNNIHSSASRNFFLLLATICSHVFSAILFSQVAYAQNIAPYQPPFFADTGRAAKILAAVPAIENIFKNHAEKNNFPGFAFGIVSGGKLVYSGHSGFANLESKIPVASTSLFRIASMTKSFTALAVMQLRDKGMLNLDDPISKYVPSIKKITDLTSDAAPITIRNLLTHSAGFPEDNPWGDRQLDDTDKELNELVEKGITFSNVPGVAYEYSNLGFALLGAVISRVSGKPYQQYITESILLPLGMTHTKWEFTQVPAKQLALGYRPVNGAWEPEPLLHDGSFGAMGGLISSVEDFSKYMFFYLASWPPRNGADQSVIKRSTLREMQQLWRVNTLDANYRYPGGRACPLVSGYAFGLRWSKDCEGRITVGHSGGLPGFGSNWIILPDYDIGIVCLSNLTYASTSQVNTRVADTLISMASLKPRQIPPSAILQQRTAELVKLLHDWKKAEGSGIFAENFFLDQSPDSLQVQINQLFLKAGSITRVTEIIPENQLRGRFIMEGGKSNILVYFTLTPENPALIQQLDLTEIPRR